MVLPFQRRPRYARPEMSSSMPARPLENSPIEWRITQLVGRLRDVAASNPADASTALDLCDRVLRNFEA